MRRMLQGMLFAALLIFPTACATRTTDTQSAAPSGRRDLLVREEIEKTQWANAYDLVRNLRPQWLRVRGRDTITGDPGGVQVVLDDVRIGGVEALRTMPVSGVTYLQWLDGITASQRWGTGFGNGAIFVSTRPR
jgi:hypothetical protein